jgi:hypothetical protein
MALPRYWMPKKRLKLSPQVVCAPAGGFAASLSPICWASVRPLDVGDPQPISIPVPVAAKRATAWRAWKIVPAVVLTGVICSAAYQ